MGGTVRARLRKAPVNQAAASEAELLAVMVRQENGGQEARAAWGELFNRHRKYVYAVASRSYGSFLGEEGTVDLVCDTFRRAFEWAGRQKSPDEVQASFAAEDADSTRRRVLGWLGAIAQQLFRDRFREEGSDRDAQADFFEQWRSAENHPAEVSDSMLLRELEVALGTLTEQQAEAVRASLPWYDVESRTFMLPRGEAARLAAVLKTTPDTLRQRRHRGIERIEEHLRQAGYESETEKEAQ
jgi:DNA-directed RNA polymerase specialized sigma24 family protein